MRSLVPAALAVTILAIACPAMIGAQTAPAPVPQSAPATPAPTPVPPPPTAAPIPAPPVSPSPAGSSQPTPAAYHYIVTPPAPEPGKPAILEIDMLEQTIRPGGPYSARVKTSLDVTTLTVSTLGTTVGMQGAGPGLFATDGQVPSGGIPFFFFNRSYTLMVTAGTADGRTTTVPVVLRLER